MHTHVKWEKRTLSLSPSLTGTPNSRSFRCLPSLSRSLITRQSEGLRVRCLSLLLPPLMLLQFRLQTQEVASKCFQGNEKEALSLVLRPSFPNEGAREESLTHAFLPGMLSLSVAVTVNGRMELANTSLSSRVSCSLSPVVAGAAAAPSSLQFTLSSLTPSAIRESHSASLLSKT